MPTLGDMDEYQRAVLASTHLLLVGRTKMGKTDYVAQAARAGFEIFYIDKDNGFETLTRVLADDKAALRRINYFRPDDMAEFIEGILLQGVFRYNVTQRKAYQSGLAKDTDIMVEFVPSRIHQNVIMAIDSWTSLAFDALMDKASDLKIDVSDIDKFSREMYGGSGFRLTNIAQYLQHAPFHIIAQAHPTIWERKEKPPGRNDVIEKDMIIKETLEVPMSSSAPHGANLGKYFNQIGYMIINNVNQRELDFTVRKDRVGGGTPNAKGDPRGAFSWVNLFGKPIPLSSDLKPWYTEMTSAEFKEKLAQKNQTAPVLKSGTVAAPAAQAAAAPSATPAGKPFALPGKKV